MTFPADDLYLGPATFGRRRGTEGFIWHTTEAADTSRASAIGTADYQKRNPGSYNFIVFDGGILLTVPYLEASGGVNPFSTAWAPERYPELKQKLSPAAYADPNAYLLNVAFSGKTAVFRDQGMPQNMVDTARRLIAWAETTFGRPMVHTSHAQWQTNRTDPGLRVMQLLDPAPLPDTSTEDDEMEWHKHIVPITPVRVRLASQTSYRKSPDLTPESAPVVLGYEDTRVMVGTVNGVDFGSGPEWGVVLSNNGSLGQGGLLTFHTQDILERIPLGLDPSAYKALQQQATTSLDNIALRAKADADAIRAKTP